ncbi:hypothetical protein VM98_25315 [Streptomyces rubellomurinus subsp. indigoferus]|nr:hypothetical protein VM98_25315 [Streptomyces rubellomurinus subsp. indigoferus]
MYLVLGYTLGKTSESIDEPGAFFTIRSAGFLRIIEKIVESLQYDPRISRVKRFVSPAKLASGI